jgi:membrane associated rhomboid family serine protease
MRSAARPAEFFRYPVTSGIIAFSIAVTIAWWAKVDISALFATAEIRRGEVWRLVTDIFPHVDVLHLIFNVYWFWVFGTILENAFGHLKYAGIVLVLAVGASSLDFSIASGGVGLSGVGYGLFGLLWCLSRYNPQFHDAMDQRTVSIFLIWFVFCIVTTMAGAYRVANVAHGGGLILGFLLGLAITHPMQRSSAALGIVLLLAVGAWGATAGRPRVHLFGPAGYEEGKWGYQSLMAHNDQQAVRWLRDSASLQPGSAIVWFDLGIAYQRTGDKKAAAAAYQRAHSIEPGNSEYAEAASELNR